MDKDKQQKRLERLAYEVRNKSYPELRDMPLTINIKDEDYRSIMNVNDFTATKFGYIKINVNPDVLECTDEMLEGIFAHELGHVVTRKSERHELGIVLKKGLKYRNDLSERLSDRAARQRGYGPQLKNAYEWIKQKWERKRFESKERKPKIRIEETIKMTLILSIITLIFLISNNITGFTVFNPSLPRYNKTVFILIFSVSILVLFYTIRNHNKVYII